MAELFVANGVSGGTVFLLPETPAFVGRTPECQVQIGDPWISGTHARLERRNGQHWVVDLGSRNGTFIDDVRVQEAPLKAGTRLRFGRTEAEYRSGTASAPAPEILRAQGTIIKPLSENPLAGLSLTPAPGPGLSEASRQVAVLHGIGKALVDAVNLDTSLAKILESVAQAIGAERSCLLLHDDQGQMVPRAYHPPDRPPPLSAAIVQAAIENRAGLLTLDAQERFAKSRSVVAQGIRSCLAAPIWRENAILGLLLFDRSMVKPFTAEDLDLITMVGYQVALAIERARFLERAQRIEEQREKLRRHFSPQVAQMILDHEQLAGDPLEVSVRDEVTVLFSDVRGFTGLTERLPPLELAAMLKEYFRAMTGAIFEQGGTLDKFIGDGIMAVFGAPVAHKDDPVRAVRCGLAMLERLAMLNETLPGDRRIQIRVGINTGRVIAGNFGSPERLEFTVLGDTVNTASRLESICQPNSIYVGKATYERSHDTFNFKALGAQQVKGKSAAVEVYQLLGVR
jgi:adenylate cyclase